MTQQHEAQQEAARAQMEYMHDMYRMQAEKGTLRSSLAAQQHAGLSNILSLGLAGLGYGAAVQNPQSCGTITGSSDLSRRKPIFSPAHAECYENMYSADFEFTGSDIPEAVLNILTSDTSKKALKYTAIAVMGWFLLLALTFGGSELYECISLMDV